MRKCFFFDFDGTLYSHRTKCVPESARKALKKLERGGHTVVLASGRGLESVAFMEREADYTFRSMILFNGQQVYRDGLLIFEHHLNVEPDGTVLTISREMDIALGGWTDRGVFVNRMNDHVGKVIEDFGNFHPQLDPSFPISRSVYMLHLYADEKEFEPFREVASSSFVFNRSHEYLVNMIPLDAGKSIGIERILELENIPREDSVAFGDGWNDRDMLSSVGLSVAMESGDERLKASADIISPSPDDDGIYLTLKKLGYID